MPIEHPEPRIVCNKCGCASDAGSEQEAEGYGWLIDRESEPHAHFCPGCVATGRRS